MGNNVSSGCGQGFGFILAVLFVLVCVPMGCIFIGGVAAIDTVLEEHEKQQRNKPHIEKANNKPVIVEPKGELLDVWILDKGVMVQDGYHHRFDVQLDIRHHMKPIKRMHGMYYLTDDLNQILHKVAYVIDNKPTAGQVWVDHRLLIPFPNDTVLHGQIKNNKKDQFRLYFDALKVEYE